MTGPKGASISTVSTYHQFTNVENTTVYGIDILNWEYDGEKSQELTLCVTNDGVDGKA